MIQLIQTASEDAETAPDEAERKRRSPRKSEVSLDPNAGGDIARKKERKEKKKAFVTGDRDDIWILDQVFKYPMLGQCIEMLTLIEINPPVKHKQL